MQSEDSDDMLMSDIHYMTEQGWSDMLQHLTRMHKLRDKQVARWLLFRNIDGDIEVSKQIAEMNNHGS